MLHFTMRIYRILCSLLYREKTILKKTVKNPIPLPPLTYPTLPHSTSPLLLLLYSILILPYPYPPLPLLYLTLILPYPYLKCVDFEQKVHFLSSISEEL